MQRPVIVLAAILCCSRAAACPVCSTSTGEQVRAGIFNSDFTVTALTVLAAVPVLAIIVLAMHFGLPWRTEQARLRSRGRGPSPSNPMGEV